jgi:PAS domain S-box-containing protein
MVPLSISPEGTAAEADLTPHEAEAILKRLAGAAVILPDRSPLPDGATAPSHGENLPKSGAEPHTGRPEEVPGEILLALDTQHGLLEAVPDALLIVGPRGHILLVNSQTERLFGYSRQELIGQPVELLIPERFRERHHGQRTGYFQKPHVRPMGQGLDLCGRRKDGSEVPVEISLSPLQTPHGLAVISTIRDISERRRAEAQLRQLEARYRTLVEGIPAVTFMAALDGGSNELYVSPQIEELLGFSQKEWLENPVLWHTQLHPEDRLRWHEEFARTCSTGEPFRSIYRFLSRSGHVVWVHGEAKVVRDESGRPLFLQGVAFDITGMKQAEEELKNLNETLEKRVAERTALAEHRAQELARSNACLEEFGYVVAHDLRQPLRTMNSYIQKLSERYAGQLDAQADDYILRSINAAGRMNVLIDDLLAYSRVKTQGRPFVPTDCAAALAAACANLEAAIDESGGKITCGPLPTVLADATQLVQLFQNLLANALKFRAERPPHLHVSAQREGDRWALAITDNGIGIEAKYLERIFRLGERRYSVAKYPGNGIGLATCEKIVQRHGGRIWAASPGLDQGSTFSFTLLATAPDKEA